MNFIEDEIRYMGKELERKKKLSALIQGKSFSTAIKELSKEIAILKKEQKGQGLFLFQGKYVDKVQQLEELILELSPEEERLAVVLHSKLCKCETGTCTWDYEIEDGLHDWSETEHRVFMDKSRNALKVTDFNTMLKLLEAGIF